MVKLEVTDDGLLKVREGHVWPGFPGGPALPIHGPDSPSPAPGWLSGHKSEVGYAQKEGRPP